jgi:glutathione synthase/RimK-type ligase-like ATP-grasp enzyme
MTAVIVLENLKRWKLDLPGVEVVRARDYLTQPEWGARRNVRLFNLCHTSGYQTTGYYVSLLADGRGHRPLPSVTTLQDLKDDPLRTRTQYELWDLMQRKLRRLKSDEFALSIYFGKNVSAQYSDLAHALFSRFPAPLMRARFARNDAGEWELSALRGIGMSDVPDAHVPFVTEELGRNFIRRKRVTAKKSARFDLAILVNAKAIDAPSDPEAIQRFVRAAREEGIAAETISKEDAPRIAEFDALFLRETTAVNHHTYRLARRAEHEGLVVIDDPTSIVRATNKVFLAEAFARRNIPHPQTMIVDPGTAGRVAETLGFPCVLKRPDSSFSAGVVKARTPAELETHLREFFAVSALVIAQAWTPSEFDWRVGVLGGKALFTCRYGMAPGHWQIQRVDSGGKRHYGTVEPVALEEAPPALLDVATRAAAVVGEGLYGVDVKERDGSFLVMEVNDNPNLDHGCEDLLLGDDLYRAVMRYFVARLETRVGDNR